MSTRLRVKEHFFDQPAIEAAVRRARKDYDALKKAGAFVRRTARSSIRKVKKKTTHSQPGQPPRSHKPTELNLRSIYFSWDPLLQGMVVGPVGFARGPGGHPVPEIHEEGLSVPVKVLRRKKTNSRKAISATQKAAYLRKIRSGEIVPRRAPVVSETVHYPERPFMGPALNKELPKFPSLWEGSVHS